MSKNANKKTARAAAVPQGGGPAGGRTSSPAAPNPKQPAQAKLPSNMAVSKTIVNKGSMPPSGPSAQEIAKMAADLINAGAVHAKKKKKKSFLSKVGGFLEGAFKKAVAIAPAVIHSLAMTVHPDWQQGSLTPAKLKQMAANIPRIASQMILPRTLTLSADDSATPVAKSVTISKRQLDYHPNLVQQLRETGAKVSVVPNSIFSAPAAVGGHVSYGFETIGDKHAKLGNGLRIRGTDYLDDILSVAGTTARGSPLGSFNLNPAQWDGTRVAKYAGMYERFIINSLSVVYTPACSTATGGALVGFFDVDPNDVAGSGRDAVVRALSYIGQDNGPVWSGHIAHYQPDPEQPDYYVDPNGSDNRLTSAGTYYCIALSALPTLGAGVAYGSLSMIYDVSFFIPSVQATLPGASPEWLVTGGGTMDGTNPLGSAPSEDSENTMDLTMNLAVPDIIYGFVGSKSIPSSYLYLVDLGGTGLGVPTITLGTGLTSLYWAYVVNGAATRTIGYGAFTCQPGVDVEPIVASFALTTVATTVTGSSLRIFRVSPNVTLEKMTLQDFEKMAITTKKTVDDLVDALAAKKVVPKAEAAVRGLPCAAVSQPTVSVSQSNQTRSDNVRRLVDLLSLLDSSGQTDELTAEGYLDTNH